MPEDTATLPPSGGGKTTTVLSIDGGGVILEFLESELQNLERPDAQLADYFDVISGTTGTGGFVSVVLAAPDANNRPLFSAKQIKDFCLENAPKISPQHKHHLFGFVWKAVKALRGPKYVLPTIISAPPTTSTIIKSLLVLIGCFSAVAGQEYGASPSPSPFVHEPMAKKAALIVLGVAVVIVLVLVSVPLIRDYLHAWATRRVVPEPIEIPV